MSDTYSSLVNSPIGARIAGALGLPKPTELRRYEPGAPIVPGPVLLGGHGAAPLAVKIGAVLSTHNVQVLSDPGQHRLGAVILDLSEVRTPADLESARAVLAPGLKALGKHGRVIVLGRPPFDGHKDPALGAVRRALEGITRSVGKELRGGGTANLVLVSDGADGAIESTIRFLLSGRSAYVSGQVFTVGATGATAAPVPDSWDRPLEGKVAVVTGAARGIGAAIADVMARDGAKVVCVDVPSAGDALAKVANRIGGTALQLDVTAEDAGARIVEHCARFGGIDIVVHNAGITRDKLLVNTDEDRWRSVLDVNLLSILRMNEALLGEGGVRDGGHIVLVSSTSGIAGNRGQANYAASKAGIIGVVETMAHEEDLAARRITVNAVAPGFIETEMTARMPVATRELGRRVNSLSQGGLPIDVAETIAYFAQDASAAVNGNVVRVCGQGWLGA
ncbi:3-oxoacyl-ACP reductase [Nostocoides sp. F2B08]|uniref:3-oxoacyl-ACP reductase n=1 Tax=Nostocoides sp. F2B08 TaxID=2653936 RepID=UPI001262F0CD|nr:3-oxoacyl-ACP reductase [Tetrasphaera sp. F2B08]KAB7743075.1 3-oxoacyl-ACP reductase [Tetrasphaera sp. F2B08]